jgi:hypothetical protein
LHPCRPGATTAAVKLRKPTPCSTTCAWVEDPVVVQEPLALTFLPPRP